MPPAGSVSADVGTSLLRLAVVVVLCVAAVAALLLGFRLLTGQLRRDRSARRRRRLAVAPATPPPQAGSPARRRAAGHHPVGRRTPGAPATRPPGRPRRPLQVVAADLRRLTRELTMVPGGLPMARRRGLLAAYDDVLVEAAELLEVPQRLTAEPLAARELERMRLLAMLEAAGLRVAD